MRIAFLSVTDPLDRRHSSGTDYYELRALQRHCGEVIPVVAGRPTVLASKVRARVKRTLFGRREDFIHSPEHARRLGRVFTRALRGIRADVVFSPTGTSIVAYLETDLPIVLWSDLTTRLFWGYTPAFSHLDPGHRDAAEQVERRALHAAAHLVYCSEWAARSAQEDFGVPADRLTVAPLGANFDDVPPAAVVLEARARRPRGTRLVFVAVDWERKGGSVAFETMLCLRAARIDAALTVVGCTPPPGVAHPQLTVIPFLDKNDHRQSAKLASLYMESDYLLLPTRREAFGVVCCEANAFALPVLASQAGGVPIFNGENGFAFPVDASPQDYARAILSLNADERSYLKLAASSRKTYDTRLNWDAWGRTMRQVFDSVLARHCQATAEPR